jgi:hypothetical protein
VYSIAAALNWLGNAISNPLYLTHPWDFLCIYVQSS